MRRRNSSPRVAATLPSTSTPLGALGIRGPTACYGLLARRSLTPAGATNRRPYCYPSIRSVLLPISPVVHPRRLAGLLSLLRSASMRGFLTFCPADAVYYCYSASLGLHRFSRRGRRIWCPADGVTRCDGIADRFRLSDRGPWDRYRLGTRDCCKPWSSQRLRGWRCCGYPRPGTRRPCRKIPTVASWSLKRCARQPHRGHHPCKPHSFGRSLISQDR